MTHSLSLAAFDEDAEDWQKFAGNLLTVLVDRLAQSAETSGSAVFVYVQRPQQFATLDGAIRVYDLDLDSTVPIMNRLFLVGLGANGGIALPIGNQSDILDALEQLGITDRPTATFYAANGVVRIYPGGLVDPENQVRALVRGQRPNFDLPTLIETIDDFHARCLITPQLAGPKLWENAGAWVPNADAEKYIQWPLRAAFIHAFRPAVTVEEEKRGAVGNPDFVFFDANGTRSDPPLAVVEAKVQKTQRANGSVAPSVTGKELARGLIQTAGYRNSLSAPLGALVCFDMRRPGAGQAGAWAKAKERCGRVLRGLVRGGRGGVPDVVTWQMFANTEAAQAAAATGNLRSTDPLYPVTKRAA